MMSETVEQRGGHLGVAEGEVGGDDGRGSLVEPAHQVEEQLPAGLGEGQVAEFVEDDEVASDELVCGAALAPGAAAKSKSASSLAVGSLADAIWYLIERACLSATSVCSSVPMICCTG